MKCTSCGAEISVDDRICKQCGELNRQNPNNKNIMSMVKHGDNARNNAFQDSINKNAQRASGIQSEYANPIQTTGVTSEVEIGTAPTTTTPIKSAEDAFKIPTAMIIVNVVLAIASLLPLLAINIIVKILFANFLGGILVGITGIITAIYAVSALISAFMNFSLQVLYEKAGEKWWSCIIPIYNVYVLNKIVFNNGWMFTIMFIAPILTLLATVAGAAELSPVLGGVGALVTLGYAISLMYKLGKKFGVSGFFTLFLAPIAIPVIAFSKKHKYLG